MLRFKHIIIICIFLVGLCPQDILAQGSTFECNGKLILTQYSSSSGPTNVYEIDVNGTTATFQQITQHSFRNNSAGYNRHDNYIYATDQGTRTVYRLFSNGAFQNLGIPPGLGSTIQLYAGACDTAGNYILSGGTSGKLYVLDVSGATATVTANVNLNVVTPGFSNSLNFSDLAFHPQTNVLYAFDEVHDRMMTVNHITGDVNIYGSHQPGHALGALFFTPFGELYGYHGNNLYTVDYNTGAIQAIAQGPSGAGRDGCSCPFSVSMKKSVDTDTLCAGDTVTYTIKIANLYGDTLHSVTVADFMNPAMSILAISNTYGGVNAPGTGPGTSNLTLTNVDLPPDTINIAIQTVVSGSYIGPPEILNQAFISDISIINDTIWSDDPNTNDLGDSTAIYVYPASKNTPVIQQSGTNCLGDPRTFTSSLSSANTTHTWYGPDDSVISNNTSFTINGLYFTDEGWYKVHVIENGCTEIWDSVYVPVAPCARTYNCENTLQLGLAPAAQTQLQSLTYTNQLITGVIDNFTTPLNALAFNHKDGCYYGFRTGTNQAYRMVDNVAPVSLGTPSGLNTTNGSYEAGTVDSSGQYFITGSSGYIAEINVMQSSISVQNSATLGYSGGQSGSPDFDDIAFHPLSNVLYGFDQNTGQLATINPANGQVTVFGSAQPGLQIGALFFNTFGELYGYGNSQLYRFDLSSGMATLLDGGPNATPIDGCSCPYGVGIEKTAMPSVLCPGDTFQYALKIYNNSGAPIHNALILDQLDPRLKVVASQHTLTGQPTPNSGPNTSTFGLQNTTLPPDTTTIWITGTNWSGFNGGDTLWNQATIQLLPTFYGNQVSSNFPGSLAFYDPTPIYMSSASSSTVDTSVCEGNQVWAGGQMQSTTGVYQDTLANQYGCDSIVTTNLTVHPTYLDTNWVEICPGGQHFAGGQMQTTSGWYTDNFTTQHGCDSTIVPRLDILPTVSDTVFVSICNGDQYLAGGQWQTTAGEYVDSLTSVLGCDSLLVTNLSVVSAIHTNTSASICQSDSLFVGGAWQDAPGIYHDTLKASSGCDSIVYTQLNTIAPVTGFRTISICQGDSLFVGGNWQTAAGSYLDTLMSASGCDSILTTQLNTIGPVTGSRSAAICAGDSFFVAGAWQKTAGSYIDTLVATSGCDSILTTQLSLSQLIYVNQTASICPGDSLFVGGGWQYVAGTYSDTLIGATGCDSILNTQLSIITVPTTNLNIALCDGDSIFVGGTWRHQSGTYRDTVTGSTGCDSILVSQVTFHPTFSQTVSTSICAGDSLFVGGNWQKNSGLYLDQYQTVQGCDSLVFTQLSVTSIVQTSWDTTVCAGEPVLFAGQVRTAPGIYRDTVQATSGCDSITTFTLNTWPMPQPDLGPDQNICQGDSTTLSVGTFAKYDWSIAASGNSIKVGQAGSYRVTVTDQNGCTGADTVNITYKPDPVVNLGADTQICMYDSVLLDATNPNASYQWSTGASSAVIYAQLSATYAVTVTMDGCTTSDEIRVSHFPLYTVELQPDTVLCMAESIILDATTTQAVGYQWSHGPVTPIVEILQEGSYEVTVTDPNGCISTDEFVLTQEYCEPAVTLPTAFSPNGDGNNDLYLVPYQNLTFTELQIYNRWGHQVFQTSNSAEGWDGTYAGEPQPIGVYVVIFRYSDETGRPFLKKANLTLIR